MKTPWSNLEGPAKLVSICAVVFLVASGLCGVQWFLAMGMRGNSNILAGFIVASGVLELIAIAGSILVGVTTLIFWGAQSLYSRASGARQPKDQVQRLFSQEDRGEDRKTPNGKDGSA